MAHLSTSFSTPRSKSLTAVALSAGVVAAFVLLKGSEPRPTTSSPIKTAILAAETTTGGQDSIAFEHTKAFQMSNNSNVGVRWPEMDIPEIKAKKPIALLFSGGGTRTFIGATGMLRAFTDLGLMDNFRYLGGASGGGWISSAYSYFAPNKDMPGWGKTAGNDSQLLGPIVYPEDLTNETLTHMDPKCLRGTVVRRQYLVLFNQLLQNGMSFPDAWIGSVHEFYLKAAGIPRPFRDDGTSKPPKLFTFNEKTKEDVYARNPSLRAGNYEFVTQKKGRPFMTIGFSAIGPLASLPIKKTNKSYRVIECNPLYTGRFNIRNVTYYTNGSEEQPPVSRLLAGSIETFAFGGIPPSNLEYQRLTNDQQYGVITSVPAPNETFTLTHAAALGGWGAASKLATMGDYATEATDAIGQVWPYWSPSTPTSTGDEGASSSPGEKFVLGDAGLADNVHMTNMLKREEIERIVLCEFSSITLNMSWNAYERPPQYTDIADEISGYFGYITDPIDSNYDYTATHVFDQSDFAPLVTKLQDAARAGTGVIARHTVTVIDNPEQGIRGGRQVELLVYYLSRTFSWEDMVPKWLANEIEIPDVRDTQVLPPLNSSFPNFPNVPLWPLDMTPQQANLLADLTGWTVHNNSAIFQDFIANWE